MKCPKCGESKYWKNGSSRGVKIFKCKCCGKFFSDAEKFTEEEKEFAIKLYLNNCGVRKTALFVHCAPSTVLEWVKKSASKIQDMSFQIEGDIIEMDEIFTKIKKNEIQYESGRLFRVH